MTILDSKIVQTELEKIGVHIDDIYDLVNTREPYPEAVPVLLDLLSQVSHDGIKEGIIRALAVKEAKGFAGKALIEEYRNTAKDKSLLRWAIGNTMEMIITPEDVEDILEIVSSEENGSSRQMFIVALGKVKKSDRVEKVLMELLNDDTVAAHALDALGRLKSQKAEEKIRELTSHKNPLIRKEAQKALKKIGK